ncbi:DUF882 domain-containing protein [Ferrimonas sediminicola]|uniref:Murein endopeptidase K n=1 Tax=Ferrimonas sediminicola TaxID=2569538 RepID=A0A4U1BEB7_9GAMM|nr:DUF882 domain-containing protein [Ferrimonas sediminicola]TKB48977.1 DUF882 domain-containing protein [Ferrimonas sediminicola]
MSVIDNNKRKLILGIGALAALSQLPAPAYAGRATPKRLSFYNRHTGESTSQTFWAENQYDQSALDAFRRVLRDHRTGEEMAMDSGLYELLYDLTQTLGTDRRIEIISGYRSPKTNAMLASHSSKVAKKSYHMKGMAIDIAIPGVELSELRRAALSLKRGGVGFYPKSGFVHLDTGRVRQW